MEFESVLVRATQMVVGKLAISQEQASTYQLVV
jgi:hypothetical protein